MHRVDRHTQQQIADLIEACVSYWELRGIARGHITQMQFELEQHLQQAVSDGNSLVAVLGPNSAAVAEGWARESMGRLLGEGEGGQQAPRALPIGLDTVLRLAEVQNGQIALAREKLREAGIEVVYTVIENLTRDGRDRSLDYKISGIDVPKGSWDARVPDLVTPLEDEIVIPKTSSSVFISTNLDYVLRNLGVRSLIIAGFLTDQCVDSAVRDACDLGYLVTLVTDACATHGEERHAWSLRNNRGYCRQVSTAELVAEIGAVSKSG